MKAQRVYIDTSVLGGCFDPEFARWSNALIEDFRADRLKPVSPKSSPLKLLMPRWRFESYWLISWLSNRRYPASPQRR